MDLTPPSTFHSNLIPWTKVLNAGVQEIRSVSLVRTCKPLWISLMHPSLHCTALLASSSYLAPHRWYQPHLLLMSIIMWSWWLCAKAWNWTASRKIPWQIFKCTLSEYSIFQQYTNTQQHSTLNNITLQKRQYTNRWCFPLHPYGYCIFLVPLNRYIFVHILSELPGQTYHPITRM